LREAGTDPATLKTGLEQILTQNQATEELYMDVLAIKGKRMFPQLR
jgi:hypothetical protein